MGLVERGQLVVRQMGIWDSIKGSATPLTERRQWSPQEPEGKVTEYEWDTKLKLETVVRTTIHESTMHCDNPSSEP